MSSLKPLPPFRQGYFDGLCGLYALINASRRADRSLAISKCRSAFRCALRWLHDKYKGDPPTDFPEDFPKLLCCGMEVNPLLSLLKEFFEKRWPQISGKQLFTPANTPKGTKEFWRRIGYEATRPGQGLIIGIAPGRSTLDHWSVVDEIADEKIVLSDSYYPKKALRLSDCGLNDEENPKHIIYPEGVILLKKK